MRMAAVEGAIPRRDDLFSSACAAIFRRAAAMMDAWRVRERRRKVCGEQRNCSIRILSS
jgi:hypothetical protein